MVLLAFVRRHCHCHCHYLLWLNIKCDAVLHSSLSFVYCDEHRFFLLFRITRLLSTYLCFLRSSHYSFFAYLNFSGSALLPSSSHCAALLLHSWIPDALAHEGSLSMECVGRNRSTSKETLAKIFTQDIKTNMDSNSQRWIDDEGLKTQFSQ